MRTTSIPLNSGKVQHDNRCITCGFEEREIHTQKGTCLMWRNVTLHKQLDTARSTV